MAKRPSLQYYPADHRKDSGIQACSLGARGLWHEMICIMHECEPYGHLTVNGEPMTLKQLSRLVGENEKKISIFFSELKQNNVFSVDSDQRVFCRRMVRDEVLRNKRKAAGMLGGNPNLVNQKVNHKVNVDNEEWLDQCNNQNLTPSSSSSSSISTNVDINNMSVRKKTCERFEEFWDEYPKKENKKAARERWKIHGLDAHAAEIIADVRARKKQHKPWMQGFIPHATTYLNGERWNDEIDDRPAANGTPDGGNRQLSQTAKFYKSCFDGIEAALQEQQFGEGEVYDVSSD